MAINRLKAVMETRGIGNLIPNEALLTRLGIKRNTFTMWVNGKTDPNMEQCQILAADLLKCPVAELFPSTDDESQILERLGLQKAG